MDCSAIMFCHLDGMSDLEHEQQRLHTLKELGVLETESFPVFDEATQTAAHFLDAPICILSVIDRDRQLFKSAVGLSRVGLMNTLASSRQLPRQDSFCNQVISKQQAIVVPNVADSAFANLLLAQRYGIQAYVGVPLVASNGYCIGTLAVMELAPRHFTIKEVAFLELMARWSMSEFERSRMIKTQQILQENGYDPSPVLGVKGALSPDPKPVTITPIKTELITQMTQELRTPLTSILGMASVLNREIYGPLTAKQKNYMDIIHNSGQYLLTLVNEILELGALNEIGACLNLSPVDVEMLCQQALSALEQAAHRREQQVQLTVEPGSRIWLLDKDKVRQLLYHLAFSVIQSSSTGSIIRIHISRKRNQLVITIWTSHPWLGDGLPQAELRSQHIVSTSGGNKTEKLQPRSFYEEIWPDEDGSPKGEFNSGAPEAGDRSQSNQSRQSLGLLLSRSLAEAHGGQISLQGSAESGYRYVISLPQVNELGTEQ